MLWLLAMVTMAHLNSLPSPPPSPPSLSGPRRSSPNPSSPCLRPEEKLGALVYLVREVVEANQPTILFAATRHHVEYLHNLFNQEGIPAACVFGAMDQVGGGAGRGGGIWEAGGSRAGTGRDGGGRVGFQHSERTPLNVPLSPLPPTMRRRRARSTWPSSAPRRSTCSSRPTSPRAVSISRSLTTSST